MKRSVLMIFLITVITITGCKVLRPAQPTEMPQADIPVEEPQSDSDTELSVSEEAPEQRISDDGILHFPGGIITLLAYEDEMNLADTLGTPLVEERIILEHADTFNGSHQKTLTYQDTKLVLFSPSNDGQRFYLINIETQNENVTTNRDITLGHTLEDLQQVYPEVTRSLDGTTGTDGRYEMRFQENPYTYIFFYVQEGKIIKIQLLHEFA